LAMTIGHAPITNPYMIHSSRPIAKIVYIVAEIAWAERDRQRCSNWGKKDAVVRIAAVVPRNVGTELAMLELMRRLLTILSVAARAAAGCHRNRQQLAIEAKRCAVPVTQFHGAARNVMKDKGAPEPILTAIRTAAMNHVAVEKKHVAGP
jgi:hypothetical protein